MFFVTGCLNGLSSVFAILVAQWFGAKKYDRMRHYVATVPGPFAEAEDAEKMLYVK